ncbi:MAG TPA: DUF4157 domain-containing protein [Longimicrobium sp.]
MPPIVHDVLRSPGRPLDPETRAFFEPRLGVDLGRVRIHTGATAAESARAVHAQAYTVGHSVVMDEGRFSPHTASGQKLLAHELAHVVQQGSAPPIPSVRAASGAHEREAGQAEAAAQPLPILSRDASPEVLARQAEPAPQTAEEDERVDVDAAARWLVALGQLVEIMRNMAALARAWTPVPDGDRSARGRAVHQYLNQKQLGLLLTLARQVFEASRGPGSNAGHPTERPELARLGEAYAGVMEQLGLALKEADVNTINLEPAVRVQEYALYAENQLQWLEGNPAAPAATAGRTTFTQREVELSARRHARVLPQIDQLEKNLSPFNLTEKVSDRLRKAVVAASYRLEPDPATGTVQPRSDRALLGRAQPALDQASAVEWAVGEAVNRLRQAERRTRVFAGNPMLDNGVGKQLKAHFHTTDTRYALLLADRLARMAGELSGEGTLAVHAVDPYDPNCSRLGAGPTLVSQTAYATPGHVHFCRSLAAADVAAVNTLIHETAHAGLPGVGATGSVPSRRDGPKDRAYEHERMYAQLSPEEAVDNAESYSSYVDALLHESDERTAAPTDTLLGFCRDSGRVRAALARAAFRIRLLDQWSATAPTGIDLPKLFPEPDRSQRVRTIADQVSGIGNDLTLSITLQCLSPKDTAADDTTLVHGHRARITAGEVLEQVPDARTGIAPAWFRASRAAQDDSLTVLLILRFRPAVPLGDVMLILAVAKGVEERYFPSVEGRTIQSHKEPAAAPAPAP